MDWKMGKHFPVREKSGNFEQTGKVWEYMLPKILEGENFSQFFSLIFNWS